MKVTDFNEKNQLVFRKFKLVKERNKHSECFFLLQNDGDKLDDKFKNFDKVYEIFDIDGDVKGQPSGSAKIFSGQLMSVQLEYGYSENLLSATFISFSRYLDVKKKTRIFQDTKKTVGNIFDVLAKDNNCQFEVDSNICDQKIAEPIVQLEETDFQFANRLAKSYGVSLWVDDKSGKESKFIIAQNSDKTTMKFEAKDFSALKEFVSKTETRLYVTLSTEKENCTGLNPGDKVSYDRNDYIVERLELCMEKDVFEYKAMLVRQKNDVESKKNLTPNLMYHFAGKVIKNTDPEHKGRVQVSFEDKEKEIIDVTSDDNNYWLPVMTMYAAKDAGVVFIPDKDDIVDAVWNGRELFVVGVYRTQPLQERFNNVDDKYICDLNGICIKFCKKDQCLEISADKTVIKISKADQNVKIMSDKTYVELNKDKIFADTGKTQQEIAENYVVKTNEFNLNKSSACKINVSNKLEVSTGSTNISATGTVKINGSSGVELN